MEGEGMAKKTLYKRPVKNAKLKEIQEQFKNYKEKNNVKVSEILKLRETNKRLREALIDIATTWQDSDEPQLTQLEMHARAKEVLEGEAHE